MAADPASIPNTLFWLQDLLPDEFPHCAIHSVGYSEPWYDLLDELKGVYDRVAEHLRSTPFDERAPIVFVAHSLGGVLLKHVRA